MNCKHFPICGGCLHQDKSDDIQVQLKRDHFINNLRHHGIDAEISSFHQSPLGTRRRATLTAKRTKKTIQVGFLERGTHNIISIDECIVTLPKIVALKNFAAIITPKIASRSAQIKFHITACANGFDVVLENGKNVEPQVRAEIASHCAEFDVRRLMMGSDVIYQDDTPLIQMGDHLITIPPHPFLQATVDCENHLRKLVSHAMIGSKNIADFFAGLGTFSIGVDQNITAFEGEKFLVNSLQNNLDRIGLHHIQAQTRDLFRNPLVPNELKAFDGAIIDPPRVGAEAQCRTLAKSNIPRIAFVSCDVKGFGRDARILLDGGYKIREIHLIDQFRFSNHLESFALFEKTA